MFEKKFYENRFLKNSFLKKLYIGYIFELLFKMTEGIRYPIQDSSEYIYKAFSLDSSFKSFQYLSTIFILDISGSMGDQSKRFMTQIFPDALDKLGYKDEPIDVITFGSKSSYYPNLTISKLRNFSGSYGGNTYLAPAISQLRDILYDRTRNGKLAFRILIVSDGDLHDHNESSKESEKIRQNFRDFDFNCAALRFNNDSSEAVGLCSILSCTTMPKNGFLKGNQSMSNDELSNIIYEYFNDGLDSSKIGKSNQNIYKNDLTASYKSTLLYNRNGTVYFNKNSNENDSKNFSEGYVIKDDNANIILAPLIQNLVSKIAYIKALNTSEGANDINRINNEVKTLERSLKLSNNKIGYYLEKANNLDIRGLSNEQTAEKLNNIIGFKYKYNQSLKYQLNNLEDEKNELRKLILEKNSKISKLKNELKEEKIKSGEEIMTLQKENYKIKLDLKEEQIKAGKEISKLQQENVDLKLALKDEKIKAAEAILKIQEEKENLELALKDEKIKASEEILKIQKEKNNLELALKDEKINRQEEILKIQKEKDDLELTLNDEKNNLQEEILEIQKEKDGLELALKNEKNNLQEEILEIQKGKDDLVKAKNLEKEIEKVEEENNQNNVIEQKNVEDEFKKDVIEQQNIEDGFNKDVIEKSNSEDEFIKNEEAENLTQDITDQSNNEIEIKKDITDQSNNEVEIKKDDETENLAKNVIENPNID